ncbi:MAG: S8 family serine peptidase [Saprospiraceae bacterium]|nr:S8 family serine peptidase [Saprospiraceae bacterium]
MRFCTLLLLHFVAFTLAAQQAPPVRFDWGTEVFPDNFQAIPEHPGVDPGELVNGFYFRYIQCTSLPTAREREALEQEGLQFIGYVQFGAYLVAIPETFDLKKLKNLRVRSLLPVPAAWKLARSLKEEPYGAWAVHGRDLDVYLQLYPVLRIEEGAAWCRQQGLTVLQTGNQNGFLSLRVPKDRVLALAAQPFVRHLELAPPPPEPEDNGGRALHRSNLLDSEHLLGAHYDGAGVNTLVRDDGPVGPHIDFQGRINNIDNTPAAFGDVQHADDVASCLGGAGNLNPLARGMAAGAALYTIHYNNTFQDQTLDLCLAKNITITNTSYTEGCNLGYTLSAQTVDQQLFDYPNLLHVFSAGNRNGANCGYGAGNQWGNISGGHKMSKNSIAVANIATDGTLNNTSSRGPAHDGRIKPEISAHGSGVLMTQPNNTYETTSGTSFSAPAVAGCFAQLSQAYQSLNNGAQPSAVLLKLAAMNTAIDLGNTGPDFKFGWGLINTQRAFQLLRDNHWVAGNAEQGSSSTHSVFVPSGTSQLRIMLYWTDPPADESAARALLNDLDLSVSSPLGTENLPWKLDPTPDPVLLDTPAGKGRDSLNNMEQVLIETPTAGTYTITIRGYEVPFGPQPYLVAWALFDDQVTLTYPAGGEGLVPGETARVHWDATGNTANFNLQYSTDNGDNWTPLASVPGDRRFYDWTVPNTISGQVQMLLFRGSKRDTTEFPFSIVPLPANLQVEKVCPDSMTVSWLGVQDSLRYDVYVLGEKYMEIIGNTDQETFSFPIQNAGAEQWFSVRANHPTGLTGRRALAVNWPGGLLQCQQNDDINLRQVASPLPEPVISCAAVSKIVAVRLVNDGKNAVVGATLSYQANAQPVVSEALLPLAPGDTLDFSFQTPLVIQANGPVALRIWSNYGAEDAFFNDTLRVSFLATVVPGKTAFTTNFEDGVFPPTGWTLDNPDNEVGWALANFEVIGPDNQPSRAIWLNCFEYQKLDQEDYIYLEPLDLTNLSNPALRFDLSHARYDNTYADSLRVEVFTNCDLSVAPKVIYRKGGESLATAADFPDFFKPNNSSDWRTEVVSLKEFAGQSIFIRLASVNDFGNNIYLDNLALAEPPVAGITASVDTVCRLDTIFYSAVPVDLAVTYDWSFGGSAQPLGTATGPGPHAIRYLTVGNKSIRLIASNDSGADTTNLTIWVRGNPTAGFSGLANGPVVAFANSSLDADQYQWDFGDNQTSTAVNPVHQYALPGVYTVTLTASNGCTSSSAQQTQTFSLDFVGTSYLPEIQDIQVLPNPAAGDFRLVLDSRIPTDVSVRLFDAQGRVLKTLQTTIGTGPTSIPMDGLDLPAAWYPLLVQTAGGVQMLRIVVQK